MKTIYDVKSLIKGIRAGERKSLSQAISCIESKRTEDLPLADQLLEQLMPQTGHSLRIGVTGVPGAGKSSFIEALGHHILKSDPQARVAVLAIDPSSQQSRGSIMADKLRMDRLAQHPRAYIRPSPHGMSPGGTSRSTQEAILLCEAAAYTHLFVETIGVGQSEIAIRDVVDIVLLLLVGGLGDQWQAMKKGILEIADIIVIHKADGEQKAAAHRALLSYKSISRLMPPIMPSWQIPILSCSSIEEQGIEPIREALLAFEKKARAKGHLEEHRKKQGLAQFDHYLRAYFMDHLRPTEAYQATRSALELDSASPRKRARALLSSYFLRRS